MAHGFSHLTARKRVRVTTGGGLKMPRGGKGPRAKPRPDPSGGKGTIPPRGGGKPGQGRGPGPRPLPNKRKQAVDYVIARRAKRGQTLNRKQARVIVKKNTRADRTHTAYRYDFAGDGAGRNDVHAANRSRKNAGKGGKKNHKNHSGGNGNKGDTNTSADNAGNSQSSDSYGGPQSLSAADRRIQKQNAKDKAKKRRQRRRNHSGNSG